MSTQRVSPTTSRLQNLILMIMLTPMLAHVAETFARKNYGWPFDYVSGEMAAAGSLVGAFMMMTLRLYVDWRRSALDLRLHGPMSVLVVASAMMSGLYFYSIAMGVGVNLYAAAFFAGVLVACLVLMVMAPSKLSA